MIKEKVENLMRNDIVEGSEMRKTGEIANLGVITLYCELRGIDIKTLNMVTGKGSYFLKVGQKSVTIKYISKKKELEKTVTLALYKLKGLRGFLRRAAEVRLLKLKNDGKSVKGPCTPAANYPHKEILGKHLEMGYHLQGTCRPMCMVRRIFGSLDHRASIKIFPPFIAKASVENLHAKVTEYLERHIEEIFGLDHCIVYQNGESTLKTEIFNIINRATDLAVNNFMKHTTYGQFPFKVVFTLNSGTFQELLENIGFFISTLFEVNNGRVQIGADQTNGSGKVTIRITEVRTSEKCAEFEDFIRSVEERHSIVECGEFSFKESRNEYVLDSRFLKFALETFEKGIKGMEKI